jgi:hypothetical protein
MYKQYIQADDFVGIFCFTHVRFIYVVIYSVGVKPLIIFFYIFY